MLHVFGVFLIFVSYSQSIMLYCVSGESDS
jgi:hypothetical protein